MTVTDKTKILADKVYNFYNKLMKAIKNIHFALTKCDLFPAQQFLRYKGQPQYKTATGGFCSLLVIAIFFVLFINSGLNVINKATVTTSFDIQHQINPAPTTLTASPEGKFMFAINVVDTGIQDGTYTYFNITLQQNTVQQLGVISDVVDIPLVTCTVDHFNFSPDIASQYYQYGVGANKWLCPPLGQQLKVSGTLVSNVYQYFSIYIKKCDPTVHTNCAPDSVLLQKLNTTGVFSAVVALIATQINPSYTKDYLSYYIEARNIFPFTNTLGVQAKSQISDFQIETDISLMPLENKVTESGTYIPDLFEHSTIPVFQDVYAYIKFDKSPNSITFSRSFQKIDDFLSYVGGLVGLVFALIFIMNSHSELCFEISIGSRLFFIDHNTPIHSGSFNFLKYIYYLIFKVLRVFGCCLRSHLMDAYTRCQEEVEKQLDILTILQRISILQRGIISLVQPSGFQLLHFRRRPTLEQVQTRRKNALLYQKYKRKVEGYGLWHKSQLQESLSGQLQIFSDQSSISSIKSPKYKQIHNRFQRNITNQEQTKCLDPDFKEKLKKNAAKRQKLIRRKQTDSEKEIIGDGYFRELQTHRLREAHLAGWSHLKYHQSDEL